MKFGGMITPFGKYYGFELYYRECEEKRFDELAYSNLKLRNS